MQQNCRFAKPYGVASLKLCCILNLHSLGEKDKECSLEWLVNTDPGHSSNLTTNKRCSRGLLLQVSY